MNRPECLVLVVGTATAVGKTWVGSRTIDAWRRRQPPVTTAARKPAQSFAPADAERGGTDADALGIATGEAPTTVCPEHRWFPVAMAPPMAAEVLGLDPFSVADLVAELAWPEPTADVGWLETVGGPRSPIAEDGDAVTLAALVDPDHVVLVADAGLGTVSAVVLSVAPLSHWPVTVVLNRFDEGEELHRRNLDWLRTREGLEVVTDPEALSAVLLPRR